MNDLQTAMEKLTLRARVEANDEWIARAQQLYLDENRRHGSYARELRESAKLSLREVARRMGISGAMLSDLERGNRVWNSSLLSKWEGAMAADYLR